MIELFPPDFSVLGTLAATYLCVAVIVKYYLMESHMVVITPEHSQGSVTWSLMVSCMNYDNSSQDFSKYKFNQVLLFLFRHSNISHVYYYIEY